VLASNHRQRLSVVASVCLWKFQCRQIAAWPEGLCPPWLPTVFASIEQLIGVSAQAKFCGVRPGCFVAPVDVLRIVGVLERIDVISLDPEPQDKR
jgi:hypothetical protein